MEVLLTLEIKSEPSKGFFKIVKIFLHLLLGTSLLIHDVHVLVSLILHILKNLCILLLGDMEPFIGIIPEFFD